MDKLSVMLPFLAVGALGVANLLAAIGALLGAARSRAEELGEGRLELLRDQHERLELLRKERRVLLDELESERREPLDAQERGNQLMREHPHLEFELELKRLTEELELERKGRMHNDRKRQRLGEELERERLAPIRTHRGSLRVIGTHIGMRGADRALARYTPNSIKWPDHVPKVLAPMAVC